MHDCDPIRPLLYRVAEGEVTPDEAILVARHLPDCTACKILLARERRLARMLEEELDDLHVGEDFVESVMSTLPDGPPPALDERSKRRKWRGLKLAGLLGVSLTAGLSVWQQFAVGGGGARLVISPPSLERATLETLLGLIRVVLVTLDAATGGLSLQLPSPGGGVGALVGLASLMVIGGAMATALLLVAARSLVRPAVQP
jgi:anti-sigma factor RsiW